MPGPWSRATTWMPRRSSSWTIDTSTSPRVAYVVILRATSEIAVASSVWSVLESSRSAASSRARWRAVTTSASDSIAIRLSWSAATVGQLPPGLQQREALLEVEGGVHILEAHPELDHRERDLRLDADDHRRRAAQPGHHGDAAQGARDERVHHVERGDVDDDPARAVARDLRHHVVAQLEHVAVGQGRLDRGDQERALLEDRDGHPGARACLAVVVREGVADGHLVAEQPLGLLDAALEVTDRVDLRQVDAE